MNHLKYIGLLFGILLGNMLPAQTEQEKLQEIVVERSWKRLVQPENADYFRYQGWVLDAFDYAPVERAAVKVLAGNRIVDAGLSDAEGRFELQIPWQVLKERPLMLRVSYLGREAGSMQLPLKTDEIVVIADMSRLLETVAIHVNSENRFDTTGYPPQPPGEHYCYLRTIPFRGAKLYRPLDEWLMMHHSEIKHTGRW
jgi:hypothetical protein